MLFIRIFAGLRICHLQLVLSLVFQIKVILRSMLQIKVLWYAWGDVDKKTRGLDRRNVSSRICDY